MARKWSWSEAQGNKTKRGSGSGGFVKSKLDYEIGEIKRMTIPYLLDEEGNPNLIMFSTPIHYIRKQGFIQLQGSKGGTYKPYTIRCMNPLSQVSWDDGKRISEEHGYCPLCTLANLQKRNRFEKIEAKFGSIEEYKAIPKDDPEKKAFNDALNALDIVEESYKAQEKETRHEMHLLMFEFASETKEVKNDFGVQKTTHVLLDSNGLPQYTPVLFKVSAPRLKLISDAIQRAGKVGAIKGTDLHIFKDPTGNDVNVAFLDFTFEFPEAKNKMLSAGELKIEVTEKSASCITQEFVDATLEKSAELIEKANKSFETGFRNLKEFSNQEYLDAMEDGGAIYQKYVNRFFTEKDQEFIDKVIKIAQGDNQFAKKETDDSGAEVELTEKPTKSATIEDESTLKGSLMDIADLTI